MEAWVPGEAELRKALSVIFKQKPPPSLSKIDPICHVALTYVKFYKHVVHHIIRSARGCVPEFRLSLLYIIDAVCKTTRSKNCGELYAERFGKDADVFIGIILGCPPKDKEAALKILRLWAENNVLPHDALVKIDKAFLKDMGQSIFTFDQKQKPNDPRSSNDPRHRASSSSTGKEQGRASPVSDLISFNYSDSDSDDEAQFERLRRIGQEQKEELIEQAVEPLAKPTYSVPEPAPHQYGGDPFQQIYSALKEDQQNMNPNPYPQQPDPLYNSRAPNQATPPAVDPSLQQFLANPAIVSQLTQLLQNSGSAGGPPMNPSGGDYNLPPHSNPNMGSSYPYQPPNRGQGPPPSSYQPPPYQATSHSSNPNMRPYNQGPPPHGNYPQEYRGPPPHGPPHGQGPPGNYGPPHGMPPPHGPPPPRFNDSPNEPYRGPPQDNYNQRDGPLSRSSDGGDGNSEFRYPIHVYCTTLYVGKLGRGVSERSLRAAFSKFGEIRTINSQGNKAFVQFTYRPDAEEAKKQMHGQVIEGREISIGWALNPRMAKESLDRTKGEGDMPPHTLTREHVEDFKQRGIIIRDYNLENGPTNAAPPNWNNLPPQPSYYPPEQPPPYRDHGTLPGENYRPNLKRSRENWGENPPPKRPYN